MRKLSLNENKFGDEGGAALLECLHNINELSIYDCKISSELETKMKESAKKNQAKISLRNEISINCQKLMKKKN